MDADAEDSLEEGEIPSPTPSPSPAAPLLRQNDVSDYYEVVSDDSVTRSPEPARYRKRKRPGSKKRAHMRSLQPPQIENSAHLRNLQPPKVGERIPSVVPPRGETRLKGFSTPKCKKRALQVASSRNEVRPVEVTHTRKSRRLPDLNLQPVRVEKMLLEFTPPRNPKRLPEYNPSPKFEKRSLELSPPRNCKRHPDFELPSCRTEKRPLELSSPPRNSRRLDDLSPPRDLKQLQGFELSPPGEDRALRNLKRGPDFDVMRTKFLQRLQQKKLNDGTCQVMPASDIAEVEMEDATSQASHESHSFSMPEPSLPHMPQRAVISDSPSSQKSQPVTSPDSPYTPKSEPAYIPDSPYSPKSQISTASEPSHRGHVITVPDSPCSHGSQPITVHDSESSQSSRPITIPDSEEEVELELLRASALRSQRTPTKTSGDEGADIDTTENEFSLRAEALKTAILKKRPSILRKKFKMKEQLKDSIENWKNVEANRNSGSELGAKKGEGELKDGKENQEGEGVDGGDEHLLRQQLLASLPHRPPPAPAIGPISLVSNPINPTSEDPLHPALEHDSLLPLPVAKPSEDPLHPALEHDSLPPLPAAKQLSQEKMRGIENDVAVNRISEEVTRVSSDGKESTMCSVPVLPTPTAKDTSPFSATATNTTMSVSDDATLGFPSFLTTPVPVLNDSAAVSREKITAKISQQGQIPKNGAVLGNKEKLVASKKILVSTNTAKNTKLSPEPVRAKKTLEMGLKTPNNFTESAKITMEPIKTAVVSSEQNVLKTRPLVSRRKKSGFPTLNVITAKKGDAVAKRIVSQKIGVSTLNVTTVNKGPAIPPERIVVSLGPDSSDDDAEENKNIKSTEIGTLVNSIDDFLSEARRRLEETTGTTPPTPEAVHAHLPPSQRLEYLQLKRKLAEKEKNLKLKSSRSSSPLSTKKLPETEKEGQSAVTAFTEHTAIKTDSVPTGFQSSSFIRASTIGRQDIQLSSSSLLQKKIAESRMKQQTHLLTTSAIKKEVSAATGNPSSALQNKIQPITKQVLNSSNTIRSGIMPLTHSLNVPLTQSKKESYPGKDMKSPLGRQKIVEVAKLSDNQLHAPLKQPKILSSDHLKSVSSKATENKISVRKKVTQPQQQPSASKFGVPRVIPFERMTNQKRESNNLSIVSDLPNVKTKLETAALKARQLMTLLRKELALEKSTRDELARLRLQVVCVEQKRIAHATRAGALRTKIKRLLGPTKRLLTPSKNSSKTVNSDAEIKQSDFRCEKVNVTDSGHKEDMLKTTVSEGISANSKDVPTPGEASNSHASSDDRDMASSELAGASAKANIHLTSTGDFENYKSPLNGSAVKGLDPLKELCPHDLAGSCRDPECPYQHAHT